MTLSIIIVNYNGEEYISNCIKSIQEQCKGIEFEIIVVDNASQDNSISLLKTNFHNEINLIESKTNLGFAKGNNFGASHSKGSHLLLLNNDTILIDNLKPALNVFNDEKIGIVGIKMLGKNNEYRYSVGHFPSPRRLLKLSSLYNKYNDFKRGNFNKTLYKVDWIEGSFLLVRKKVWDLTNGLDEDYFMYVEDIDFCKKVSLKNYKVVYFPLIKYIHFGGYVISRENLLKVGLKIFINKHFKGPYKQLSLLGLAINFKIKNFKKTIKKIY